MTAIYKKWIPRWNDETLWTVLEYARYKKIAYLKEQEILQLNRAVTERDRRIFELTDSTSWYITQPLRIFGVFLKKILQKNTGHK
jgi:hypothetical protein